MFKLVLNRDVLSLALKMIKEKHTNLPTYRLNMIIDIFAGLDDPYLNQTTLLLRLLQMNSENLNANKYCGFLVSMKSFLLDLTGRRESTTIEFLRILANSQTGDKLVNFNSLYTIAYRLDDHEYENKQLVQLVAKSYEASQLRSPEKALNIFIEMSVAEYLIKNKSYSAKWAMQLIDRTLNFNAIKQYSKITLLSYILNSQISAEDREKYEAKLSPLRENLEKKLTELNSKSIIDSFSQIFTFPESLLLEKQEYYLQVFKDHIGLSNHRQYFELVTSLSKHSKNQSSKFYNQFLRELANKYPQFSSKFSVSENTTILQAYTSWRFRAPALYNQIFTEIAKHVESLRKPGLVSLLQSMSRLGYKQNELLDQVFLKIFPNRRLYSLYDWTLILDYLYELGYDSTLFKSKIESLLNDFRLSQKSKRSCDDSLQCYDQECAHFGSGK
jgi:hypothetical protein